jgi:hypothetical protein
LKKRAKEAKKRRDSSSSNKEIIRSSTQQQQESLSIPVSSPNLSSEESKLYQVYDVYKV